MKVAPIIAAIEAYNSSAKAGCRIQHVLVHTDQHYGQLMSDAFFAELNLPQPDVHLGVGSGSHAAQTAEIMRKFEEVLLREKPDILLVVGDVNSTVACALVAAKISFGPRGRRPLIAHVEAGLRSFDRTMPEEINRIVTDQLSDLLFVTEESGLRNLGREGVSPEKTHFVGNTMIDSLLSCYERAEGSTILKRLGLVDGNGGPVAPYALLTLHRPANVDDADTLSNILHGLDELARTCVVIFAGHPRTHNKIVEFGLERLFRNDGHGGTGLPDMERRGIRMIDPLGYLDCLCLMKHARLVVTDSGGMQEETTCLGVPCVTVRDNTERPVTLEIGTNVLAGVQSEGIRQCVRTQMSGQRKNGRPPKWDGEAGRRIVETLAEYISSPPQSATQVVAEPN